MAVGAEPSEVLPTVVIPDAVSMVDLQDQGLSVVVPVVTAVRADVGHEPVLLDVSPHLHALNSRALAEDLLVRQVSGAKGCHLTPSTEVRRIQTEPQDMLVQTDEVASGWDKLQVSQNIRHAVSLRHSLGKSCICPRSLSHISKG